MAKDDNPRSTVHKEVLRLAVLLAAIALATSRIGLIGHELVGHGGMALACGARIVDVELFWFAGGWIRYQMSEPSLPAILAIAMAGIGLELVVGLLLVQFVRGATLGRRLVRGIGAGLVVHATWYLATGAFHGFGDGLVLYRALGDARVAVAIAAGLVTCAAAYLAARNVLGTLAATVRGGTRARVLGVIVAAVLAGGLHAGLAWGELRIRRDATYTATMQHQRDRDIATELAQWQREQAARGTAIDDAQRRAEEVRLAQKHKTFPFVWLLAVATIASVIAGAVRARKVPDETISNRLLAITVAVALGAICAVILIDVLVAM
ncbi:MAG TPA: hypothetical protein VFV99_25640 [Kofleriaceae bacterium]|nr:hypothetical protein [Kofleriaceae bacterium]